MPGSSAMHSAEMFSNPGTVIVAVALVRFVESATFRT